MIESLRGLSGRLRQAWRGHLGASVSRTGGWRRELSSQLDAEKCALHSFTCSIEEEFLALGSLLRKTTTLARQIRERSDEVIAGASGPSDDAAIQFAFQLLKKAEDLVQASREQHKKVFAVFEKMHTELIQVALERGALMRTLSPLETTSVQFRIQACAFDESTQAQFFGLADDIRGIVTDVRTAVGQRFEELERTGTTTGQLVTRLTATGAEQEMRTEEMLAGSRTHLSTLNDALLSSETVAQSMSQSGAKIAGGVAKAIVALQCQDMARQKIEHINAAIDDMIAHLGAALDSGPTPAEESDCRSFLADAGRIQLGQLNAVFAQLEDAASAVATGSQEVEAEAREFAGQAVRCGAAMAGGEMIAQTIGSIRAVLGIIDTAVKSVRSVADLAHDLKATFSDCTSQIVGLALRLRMVALNAQVFASRVEAGAALEVVGKNTGTITDEAMQQLNDISVRVAALVDLVIDLEQRLEDYRELAEIEHAVLVREAEESEKRLHAVEQQLSGATSAIEPLERELAATIRRTTECIRFPEAVSQCRQRSTALFSHIADEYSDSAGGGGMVAHHKVEALKRNYTMAHERDVHESVVEKATGELCPSGGMSGSPEGEIAGKDEELADNVELF